MRQVASSPTSHRRRWRDYRTATGGRPVKAFLDELTDGVRVYHRATASELNGGRPSRGPTPTARAPLNRRRHARHATSAVVDEAARKAVGLVIRSAKDRRSAVRPVLFPCGDAGEPAVICLVIVGAADGGSDADAD
jgi:hypothetical protein